MKNILIIFFVLFNFNLWCLTEDDVIGNYKKEKSDVPAYFIIKEKGICNLYIPSENINFSYQYVLKEQKYKDGIGYILCVKEFKDKEGFWRFSFIVHLYKGKVTDLQLIDLTLLQGTDYWIKQ